MTRKIIVAKYGGFCFGVKKAVNLAMETARRHDSKRPLYSYGPLIHNEQVTDRLASRGVEVIDSLDAIDNADLIIRSHGVPAAVYDSAKAQGLSLIDTTCVFVKRVHDIVKQHSEQGDQVVIIGDKNHPEIIGISGWCSGSIIINSVQEAKRINTDKALCVVAQTTLNTGKWQEITDYLVKAHQPCHLYNTICSATKQRQDEVREIAKQVDLMIVIGGKNSSNTQKLYEISQKICKKSLLIQDFTQIEVKFIRKYGSIGIVAGASTPDWIIDEVIQKLKFEGEVVFNGKQ